MMVALQSEDMESERCECLTVREGLMKDGIAVALWVV